MAQQSIFFLILNASIVWAVLAGGMMWLLRSKLLVFALLLSPYVISTLQGCPSLSDSMAPPCSTVLWV